MNKSSSLQQILFRSWWVIAFALLCLMCYEQGLKKNERHYASLQEQLLTLQKKYQRLIKEQKYLQEQLKSFSDQDWLEYLLMQELGLISNDQTKIYFKHPPPNSA